MKDKIETILLNAHCLSAGVEGMDFDRDKAIQKLKTILIIFVSPIMTRSAVQCCLRQDLTIVKDYIKRLEECKEKILISLRKLWLI